MENILRKLSSRKFWAAAAGLMMGLSLVFGLDEGIVGTVSGAVVSAAAVVTYIVTEGRIDAAAALSAISAAQSANKAINVPKEEQKEAED